MYEDRRGRSRRDKIYQTVEVWVSTHHTGAPCRCRFALRPVCNGVTVQSTAMRRAFVSALVLSALSVPTCYGTVWAGPLQINPDAYTAAPPDQDGAAAQPQQRSAQTQSTLGGGFIEFLFGGAAREPMIQRPFQPLPEANPRSYQPGQPDEEAQQAALTQLSSNDPATFALSSQGDMAHSPVDPKYDRQLV